MARGGRRAGAPGARYGNRTDLQNGPRVLPATAVPNQTYGQAGTQLAAQRAIPMASGPALPAPQTVAPAAPLTPPVQPIPLDAPTSNPAEHVMTGAPVGPGAGPEALSFQGTEGRYQSARDQVIMLARSQPQNDALQYLMAQLGANF